MKEEDKQRIWDEWQDSESANYSDFLLRKVIQLESQLKEERNENKGLKVQMRALQDAVNELHSQLKEEREAAYWYYCNSFTNEDIDTDKLLEYDKTMEKIEKLKP